jgi:hypothetical protein
MRKEDGAMYRSIEGPFLGTERKPEAEHWPFMRSVRKVGSRGRFVLTALFFFHSFSV